MPGPDFIPGPAPESVPSAHPGGSGAGLLPGLLGSPHRQTDPCKHFSSVGTKEARRMDQLGHRRRHPFGRAPLLGAPRCAIWVPEGPLGVDPRGRRPGGLCLWVHGKGLGGGIRGGVRGRREGGSGSGKPCPGAGGAERGRSGRGSGLTSPGTAPSTPSRYSGTARAAAGRCWRRGRCRRLTANRCTGCTPAPRRAG